MNHKLYVGQYVRCRDVYNDGHVINSSVYRIYNIYSSRQITIENMDFPNCFLIVEDYLIIPVAPMEQLALAEKYE